MNPLSNWLDCQKLYKWTVNLKKYEKSTEYPGYFKDEINPGNTRDFEDKFRKFVNDGFPLVHYVVCGEVYFWKNYRSISKNTKTDETLQYLAVPEYQKMFIESLKELARNPIHNNFLIFRKSCDLPNGFATPITYLSFYMPDEYPMIDKIIANWWRDDKNRSRFGIEPTPLFVQRKGDGWIQAVTERDSISNWSAYLAWKEFCIRYSTILTKTTGTPWRARDVEMAVWESQKRCYPLYPLQ